MNDKIKLVLQGYLRLSDDDKAEFEKLLGLPQRDPMTRRGQIERTTKEFVLGPVGSGCPCCGK